MDIIETDKIGFFNFFLSCTFTSFDNRMDMVIDIINQTDKIRYFLICCFLYIVKYTS